MTDLFVQDLRGSIEKVGVFLQCGLQEEELSSCVEHSRFSSMKDNKMINYSLVPEEIIDHKKGSFMRKGGLSWTFASQFSLTGTVRAKMRYLYQN